MVDDIDRVPDTGAPPLYYTIDNAERNIGLPKGGLTAFGLIGTIPHFRFGDVVFIPCYIVDSLRDEFAYGSIGIGGWALSGDLTVKSWQVAMRLLGYDACWDIPLTFLQGMPEVLGSEISAGVGRIVRGRWNSLKDYQPSFGED